MPPPDGDVHAAALPFPLEARDRSPLLERLPSGRILAVAFAVVVGAALAYVAARETPLFAIRSVVVTGAPPAVAADAQRALAPLKGRSLVALGAADVESRLAELPAVAAASYDRAFPHTLRVSIRAERPIAVVRRGPDAWLVSAKARAMRGIALGAAPRLPRVWVRRDTDVEAGTRLTDRDAVRAVRVLLLARALRVPGRVRFVRTDDEELTLVLASGLELRLGDVRALPLKLAIVRRVLPRLVSATPGYAYLDVSVPERPVAGREPSSLS